MLQKRTDIERLLNGTKVGQPKFLGVLAEESTSCFFGQLSKFTTPSGTEKTG